MKNFLFYMFKILSIDYYCTVFVRYTYIHTYTCEGDLYNMFERVVCVCVFLCAVLRLDLSNND